jgi:hypothetical protein
MLVVFVIVAAVQSSKLTCTSFVLPDTDFWSWLGLLGSGIS